MLKIFRKIRKQLAAENNVTKYIRYAIGEILLVVIGILIALQINNWNEQRKEFKKQENLYKNIILDLEEDAQSFEKTLILLKTKQDLHYQLYEEAQDKRAFNPKTKYGIITIGIGLTTITFDNYRQSSDKISDDNIRKMLNQYFRKQRNAERAIEQISGTIEDRLRSYLGSKNVLDNDKVYDKPKYQQTNFYQEEILNYKNLKSIMLTNEFQYLLFDLRVSTVFAIDRVNKLLIENRQFVKKLRTELR